MDDILFGQYLIRYCPLNLSQTTLDKALHKQDEEMVKKPNTYRRIGQILLEDFNVFKDQIELDFYVAKFHKFKYTFGIK